MSSVGSLVGAIIGTFFATLVLLAVCYLVWEWERKRRTKRSGLHNLVIVEDGGGTGGGGDGKAYSYDNPGFIDESSGAKKSQQGGGLDAKFNGTGKPASQQNGSKKAPWGPLSFLFKSRTALDDSVVEEPQRYNVALKGHDFTGLGFNICGNMRDGIFVKDIMQRGPAAETKQILLGDQITGMTVSFRQMVLEDAITLLSYASPYEVNLEMLRLSEKSLPHKGIFMSSPAHPSGSSGQSNTLERVCHPFFKSQSIDDLRKVGKEHLDLQVDRKKKQANGVHAKTSGTGGTIEIPTVVVVGNNENRSSSSSSKATSAVKMPKLPKMNFSFGSSSSSTPSPKASKAPEAHQKSSSSSSSAQIQIPMPDEIDGPKGPIVSVTKPEIVPRTKVKTSLVQKSNPDDMELVEAISPAIEKMTAEFEKSKKDLKGSMQINEPSTSSTTAVLDIQPVEINMTGQPSVQVETNDANISTKLPDAKMELPSAEVDVRAPSMVMMPSVTIFGSKDKDSKKKEKSEKSSKLKSPALDIDLTPPDLSLKGGIEMGESSGDKEDSAAIKKPQRGQKTKDKADKSKEKEGKASKAAGKEPKEKDSSEHQQGESSTSGEKSKFFKFGIPVLPEISWNFGVGGSKSSAGDDKDKDKEKGKESKEKEKATKEKGSQGGSDKSESDKKESEPSGVTLEASLPKVEVSKPAVEVKSSEFSLNLPSFELKKDDKKEKEPKEKSSKDKEPKEKSTKEKESKEKPAKESKEKSPKSKDKGKEKEEKQSKEAKQTDQPESEDQQKDVAPQKEKSGSSGFIAAQPGAEPIVEASPDAAATAVKEGETKTKAEKSSESTPSKSKKKEKSEKKNSSRPTSPDGHRTTDDEADKSMDVVDSVPGEKSSRKGSGFHMPHIGIKLPKFGHSKQTYSFENVGDNKDLKHSHGPTAESLLEASPAMKIETTANTAEFRKMTPTPDEIQTPEVAVKVEQPQLEMPTVSVAKKGKDEVDSGDVRVEVEAPKITLPSVSLQMPTAEVKVETEQKEGSAMVFSVPEETISVEAATTSKSTPDEESSKKEQEMKDKESPKEKESKPSFVSKGLKGLRDLKDKVAHKLSHDHTQHDTTTSEDEAEPGDVKVSAAVTKEKVKKEKKSKESREKSKEEKAREKEEKAKEKERIKAEKKLKKAELKKKLSSAHSSSSSSSSSSSDESDADDGTGGKVEKKEKKKSKTKDSKSAKEKKKKDKKEKLDKKLSGIEIQAEIPGVELQNPEITASSAIEKQLSGHEAKLIPAKPPVVPRKSRDSLKDESGKGAAGDEMGSSKGKLKKSKSKGDTSTSSSSSSSESDSENKKDDKEGKPKKPKRTPKRKAPEVPSVSTTATSIDVPDLVKITTSAEVISPPREDKKSEEMRESTPSKTPESGRRSASYGDLSSLHTKPMGEGPLERAMSMDMAGDKENSNEPGAMPVGSSQEDLSVMPDSKTITHLSRNQQHHQGLRDSIASKSSTSSCETLKASPTSVVQVHPKEQQPQELVQVTSSQVSQNAPTTTTISVSSEQDPHSSTIQKMMNETLSVMNNIVHEMDSPSLVKSAMSSGQSTTTIVKTAEPQVTISTSGTSLVEKSEAEKVAQQTVDEIMEKARASLSSDMSVSVTSKEHDGPKVSVSTGDNNDNNTMISDLAHSLSADMEGGADSFSIASVKIQGMDGDSDEPVSVRNITVTNIKNVPKQAIDVDNSGASSNEPHDQVEVSSSGGTIISGSSDPSKAAPLLREDSKARLLQTVADAKQH
ncbi:hypothetical protein Ocin01_00036 [Orchesella cincta]|uniref:PDZ domain-containing protein n=1 Tax=Orchesella cincta TaxID=48709 RepID=A0A1D2NN43_ORCCI|nr:hypothetical protein Ocin01_00036 [Orchesella cincta]